MARGFPEGSAGQARAGGEVPDEVRAPVAITDDANANLVHEIGSSAGSVGPPPAGPGRLRARDGQLTVIRARRPSESAPAAAAGARSSAVGADACLRMPAPSRII